MSIALALALAVGPAPGEAGARIAISWEAPSDCPSAPEIRDRIGEYLGRDEFGAEIDQVVVRGVVSPRDDNGRWQLSVSVDLPRGTVERSVESARCEELRDAAALIIAVALDPLRLSRRVKPPTAPAPATPIAPVESKPPPPARRLFADVRVGGALEIGSAPRIAAGPWLAIALVGPRFRAEVISRWLPPVDLRPFADPARAGISVQSGVIGVRGCFVPRVGRVEFPSCLQFEAGAWRGSGIGLEVSRVTHRPWVAVAVGQELVWHSRRRIGLWVAADAVITLVRPRFAIDDLGTVLTPGWALFRLVVGPSVRF